MMQRGSEKDKLPSRDTNSHKMVRKAELVSSITSPVTRVCMALQKYAVLWSETSVVKFNSDVSPFSDVVIV